MDFSSKTICARPAPLKYNKNQLAISIRRRTGLITKSYFHETIGKMETTTVIPWKNFIVRLNARKAIHTKSVSSYIPM